MQQTPSHDVGGLNRQTRMSDRPHGSWITNRRNLLDVRLFGPADGRFLPRVDVSKTEIFPNAGLPYAGPVSLVPPKPRF